jgi:Ca-activated chloride channel homolog
MATPSAAQARWIKHVAPPVGTLTRDCQRGGCIPRTLLSVTARPYKIKELDGPRPLRPGGPGAVSQTFVNTGSRQMEVSFCLSAALRRRDRPDDVHGRRQGVRGQAAAGQGEARKIYEELRPQEPGSGAAGVDGERHVQDERLSRAARRRAEGDAAVQPAAAQARAADRLPLPAQHGQVHLAAGREGVVQRAIESQARDQERLQPHAFRRHRAPRQQRATSSSRQERGPTERLPPVLRHGKDGKLGASVLSYRPEKDEDGYFLLLASPEIKATSDERPKKTVIFVVDRSGSMSGKKIEQAKEALKFVLNNLREGDTVQHRRYDSTSNRSGPSCRSTTTRRAKRRWASSRASTPAAARTSTAR